MDIDYMKNKAGDAMQKTTDAAKEVASNPKKEITKSGKEWLCYVQKHPLQSILFGLVGYFALKGIKS